MKNKILIFNLAIITLSLLTVFFSGITLNKNSHRAEAEAEVKTLTEAYKSTYDENNIDKMFENAPDGVRLTVINDKGEVVKDTDGEITENHLGREEIIAAIGGNPKVVVRYSNSLKKDMVYYALKAERTDGGYDFIRVAIPVADVDGYVKNTIPTLIYVLIAAIFICYIASILMTSSLVKPIKDVKDKITAVKNGDYSVKIPASGDEEVNTMLSEINDVSELLQKSIQKANDEKERLDYILRNISDGIIVLDTDGTITEFNKNASRIFDIAEPSGKNYSILTANENFNAEIADCLPFGADKRFEYSDGGKTFIVSVNRLDNGYTIIVLSDITAVKNSEKTRSEFFANASHELKTPLTSIKGFNDIVSMSTKEEKTKELSLKIDKEVTRIVTLINDMLDLSRLEAEEKPQTEKIDLKKVSEGVIESLSALAEKKSVTVKLCGEGTVDMESEHAVELVKNLVENAIRYNNDGGHVFVDIKKADGAVKLIVKDDGIGIEDKYKQRIFERFYRVDKSRSREMGGTGLGLSIVKHICTLYNAGLTLESTLGVGTTITVSVPVSNASQE